MMGVLKLVIFLTIFAVGSLRSSPALPDTRSFGGKHFKVFNGTQKGGDAREICSGLLGEWRLPTIGEVEHTDLSPTWVLGPEPSECYTVSAEESRLVQIPCDTKIRVVCIAVQDGVPSESSVLGTSSALEGEVRDDLLRFKEFIEDEVEVTETRGRWKRGTTLGHRRRVTGGKKVTRTRVGGQTRTFGARNLGGVATNRKVQTRKFGSRVQTSGNVRQTGMTASRNVNQARGAAVGNKHQQAGVATQGGVGATGTRRTGVAGSATRGGQGAMEAQAEESEDGQEWCIGGWKNLGRSCVKMFENTLSWQQAKASCETYIYHESTATLVNFSKKRKRIHVLKWLASTKGGEGNIPSFWTSGNDLNDEGVLQWSDRPQSNVGRSPRLEGNSNDNDCVLQAGIADGGGLQIVQCDQPQFYVCEMQEPAITKEDLVRR